MLEEEPRCLGNNTISKTLICSALSIYKACSYSFSYFILPEARESKMTDLFLDGKASYARKLDESLHFLPPGPVYVLLHTADICPHLNASEDANRLLSQGLSHKHLAFHSMHYI